MRASATGLPAVSTTARLIAHPCCWAFALAAAMNRSAISNVSAIRFSSFCLFCFRVYQQTLPLMPQRSQEKHAENEKAIWRESRPVVPLQFLAQCHTISIIKYPNQEKQFNSRLFMLLSLISSGRFNSTRERHVSSERASQEIAHMSP